jgi:hypothetical protein
MRIFAALRQTLGQLAPGVGQATPRFGRGSIRKRRRCIGEVASEGDGDQHNRRRGEAGPGAVASTTKPTAPTRERTSRQDAGNGRMPALANVSELDSRQTMSTSLPYCLLNLCGGWTCQAQLLFQPLLTAKAHLAPDQGALAASCCEGVGFFERLLHTGAAAVPHSRQTLSGQ